jgi:hypothetical protein
MRTRRFIERIGTGIVLPAVADPPPAEAGAADEAVPVAAPPPPPPQPRTSIGQLAEQIVQVRADLGQVQADVTGLRHQATEHFRWVQRMMAVICEGLDLLAPPFPLPPPESPQPPQ